MDAAIRAELTESQTCIICDTRGPLTPTVNEEYGMWTYHCTNCGPYLISEDAISDLVEYEKRAHPDHMALISHRIRRMQRDDQPPYVSNEWLREIFQSELVLPSAFEQLENLVIWMAENLGPGEASNLSPRNCQAVVGSATAETLAWVLRQAENIGWISGIPREVMTTPYELLEASLTIQGWQWYDEIGRHKQSKLAFMAMQYGDEQLHGIVEDHFRPAVTATGFDLQLLVDRPEAGIIDNRLRVEIRRSRFVIADLTHRNNGAYWEAGFGEGLGIPVIYTCRQDVLDEERGVHFDTRNSLIVPWAEDNIAVAVSDLKATIRNSLPDDALLADRLE